MGQPPPTSQSAMEGGWASFSRPAKRQANGPKGCFSKRLPKYPAPPPPTDQPVEDVIRPMCSFGQRRASVVSLPELEEAVRARGQGWPAGVADCPKKEGEKTSHFFPVKLSWKVILLVPTRQLFIVESGSSPLCAGGDMRSTFHLCQKHIFLIF